MPKRTETEIMDDLRRVDCAMSPENLTCDGELSRRQINAKKVKLSRQWVSLCNELGRIPTTEELYSRKAVQLRP